MVRFDEFTIGGRQIPHKTVSLKVVAKLPVVGAGLVVGDHKSLRHTLNFTSCVQLPVTIDDLILSVSVFVSAFGVSAFAGLAALLRFSKKISKLAIFSSMLNAGLLGLAIALIWYQNYREAANIHGLIGICVLAGMGGSTITDVLISILSGAGIKVIINHERDRDELHRHGADDNEPKNPQ